MGSAPRGGLGQRVLRRDKCSETCLAPAGPRSLSGEIWQEGVSERWGGTWGDPRSLIPILPAATKASSERETLPPP